MYRNKKRSRHPKFDDVRSMELARAICESDLEDAKSALTPDEKINQMANPNWHVPCLDIDPLICYYGSDDGLSDNDEDFMENERFRSEDEDRSRCACKTRQKHLKCVVKLQTKRVLDNRHRRKHERDIMRNVPLLQLAILVSFQCHSSEDPTKMLSFMMENGADRCIGMSGGFHAPRAILHARNYVLEKTRDRPGFQTLTSTSKLVASKLFSILFAKTPPCGPLAVELWDERFFLTPLGEEASVQRDRYRRNLVLMSLRPRLSARSILGQLQFKASHFDRQVLRLVFRFSFVKF